VKELEERLRHLEKQVTRLKILSTMLALLLASLFILGATSTKETAKVIEAETFIVKDAQGRKRVLMGILGEVPCLAFLNEMGKSQISVALVKDAPSISLYYATPSSTKAPHLAISFGVGPSPTLTFFDTSGTPRLSLRLAPDRGWSPALGLHNTKGQPTMVLTANTDEPALMLFGDQMVPRSILSIHEGIPRLDLYDFYSKAQVSLLVRKGIAGLNLNGSDGRPKVSLWTFKNEGHIMLRDDVDRVKFDK